MSSLSQTLDHVIVQGHNFCSYLHRELPADTQTKAEKSFCYSALLGATVSLIAGVNPILGAAVCGFAGALTSFVYAVVKPIFARIAETYERPGRSSFFEDGARVVLSSTLASIPLKIMFGIEASIFVLTLAATHALVSAYLKAKGIQDVPVDRSKIFLVV